MTSRILIGDCRARMAELPDASVDSVVCDPPYHLVSQDKRDHRRASPSEKQHQKIKASTGFMGQTWDGGDVAFDPETWAEVLRVLKPGGHLIAFSGTRTYHRMVCAIEDAGFEIRDQLAWVYGSGFPKSLDVSKQIDKMAGAEREVVGRNPNWRDPTANAEHHERWNNAVVTGDITAPATDAAREWQGWGTALKPSWEPICLARKPLIGTVAANVMAHGTGAINIDGCRIEADVSEMEGRSGKPTANKVYGEGISANQEGIWQPNTQGRWPANLCHDGSEEVLAGFPETAASSGHTRNNTPAGVNKAHSIGRSKEDWQTSGPEDSGSAARFFYCAKSSSDERGDGNNHPTVKPVALMRWLVRLVTPKGGTVLDPFMGSGSTLLAAEAEQFNAIGCELSPDYAAIAERRLKAAGGMFADVKIDRKFVEAA